MARMPITYSFRNTNGEHERINGEILKYSMETYYDIMSKISIIGLFHAMYPNVKIKIGLNHKFKCDVCPSHANTQGTFSLLIDDKEQFWYCLGCHSGGMAVDLIIEYYSFDNNHDKALEIISHLCGTPLNVLDQKQKEIYDLLKENYAFENQYQKESEEYTASTTEKFKNHLNKSEWTWEAYKRISRKYGGIRVAEIEQVLSEIDIEKQKTLALKRRNPYINNDLPF